MLLDTHIWLWVAAGVKRKVGPRTVRALERARARGVLHVSAVSIFEIVALQAAGRLDLARAAEHWVRESVDSAGLRVLDLTSSIAVDAGSIPASALADPCDRFLVASARRHALSLVTRDARILDYARTSRTVAVVDAAP